MCVSVCKYAYVYKVWTHVQTQTHNNWICIPTLVWGHISSSTQTHTDTHHKLSAPYSHKYCVKDGILLHSYTYLSAPSPQFILHRVKLSSSWNLNCLQRRPVISEPQHTHTQLSPANIHTANTSCLFTLEVPIASQSIHLGWYHQMLLTSSIISQIHLKN